MFRAALRSAMAHRLRLLLTAVAVMLGVTFVSGTLTYTDSIDDVFSSMVDEGSAGVDVYVRPKTEFESLMDYGPGGAGIPERVVEEIAQVDGQRLVPDRRRIAKRAIEMHALDQHIGGDNFQPVPLRLDHRRVIPDSDLDPRGRRRNHRAHQFNHPMLPGLGDGLRLEC